MKHCPLSLWGLPNQSLEDGKVGVPFNGPLSQVFSKIVHNVEETDVYEIGIQVHCGVILIINGREQFRVNVPSGPLASTAVSDCFPAPRYLYFVGNGNVLTPNTSITIATMNRAKSSNITELSMWMAVYPQPSANRTISLLPSPIECYTIAYPNSLYVDNAFTHPPDIAKITDDDASTAPSTWPSSHHPLRFSFGSHYLNINGVSTLTSFTHHASTFRLSGVDLQRTTHFLGAFQTHHASAGQFSQVRFPLATSFVNGVTLSRDPAECQLADATKGLSFAFQELHFLVCSAPAPSQLPFARTLFSFHLGVETVSIAPTLPGVRDCTIAPQPTRGLVFHNATCTLEGRPEVIGFGTYTVFASYPTALAGSFAVKVEDCAGSIIEIRRVYGANASLEGYALVDEETGEVVEQQDFFSTQYDHTVVSRLLCLSNEYYDLRLTSLNAQPWSVGSSIRVVLRTNSGVRMTLFETRYDAPSQHVFVTSFNVRATIPPDDLWYYRVNGDVPETWMVSDFTDTWWCARTSIIPAATSRFAFFQKKFTVSETLFRRSSGVYLAVRYQFGFTVAMNRYAVLSVHVSDWKMGENTTLEGMYNTLQYRQIALPLTLPGLQKWNEGCVRAGENLITVALLQPEAGHVPFDLVLLVNGQESVDRMHDVEVVSSWSTNAAALFDHASLTSATLLKSTSLTFRFKNDRREAINYLLVASDGALSSPVQSFVLEGKNAEDKNWKTITRSDGYYWWKGSTFKATYVMNHYAYNTFRLSVVSSAGSPSAVLSQFSLGLNAVGNPGTLSMFPDHRVVQYHYPAPTYRHVRDFYYDVTISPSLPNMHVDAPTGTVVYDAFSPVFSRMHEVYAKHVSGGVFTEQSHLSVASCPLRSHFVTFFSTLGYGRTQVSLDQLSSYDVDAFHQSFSFSFRHGASEEVLQCLPRGIYSLTLRPERLTRASAPFGVTIQLGLDRFPVASFQYSPDAVLTCSFLVFSVSDDRDGVWKYSFEVGGGESRDMRGVSGGSRSVEASSYSRSAKKVLSTSRSAKKALSTSRSAKKALSTSRSAKKTSGNLKEIDLTDSDWTSVDFDDSAWATSSIETLPATSSRIVRLRKSFTTDYADVATMVHARVFVAGGVEVFWNGNRVCAFNIEYLTRDDAELINEQARPTWRRCSFPFRVFDGAAANVVSLRVIRSTLAQSMTLAAYIDLAMEKDAPLLNTFDESWLYVEQEPFVDGVEAILGNTHNSLLQVLPNRRFMVSWVFSNIERTLFNALSVRLGQDFGPARWTLFGSDAPLSEYELEEMLHVGSWPSLQMTVEHVVVRAGVTTVLPFPIGLVSSLMWFVLVEPEQLQSNTPLSIVQIAPTYSVSALHGGKVCKQPDYAPVLSGAVSTASCPDMYYGYIQCRCVDGAFQAEDMSQCSLFPPSQASYPHTTYVFIVGAKNNTSDPAMVNAGACSFRSSEKTDFPADLVLSPTDGVIMGVAEALEADEVVYEVVVVAENKEGAIEVPVTIVYMYMRCEEVGKYDLPSVRKGSRRTVGCDVRGMAGRMRWECTEDEEGRLVWKHTAGFCFGFWWIDVFCVLACVVVLIVVVWLASIYRQQRAVRRIIGLGNKLYHMDHLHSLVCCIERSLRISRAI